ncbi:DUF3631 domain-containing protein [Kitasatospora sp. DSM 101779]|uniref:DUF3631 domain-containing protein n=1 Tax=Kitasatospora sp. DSM 101779 TaxID=2853165 RepID=UPI0021D83523|nr:DUF3631 domain-containing protein [Kitasatospora sp. DSM 101779]MCU7823854.1 DUF3631 domain-containing protein [Kitasatospora sp. DSM 101779]
MTAPQPPTLKSQSTGPDGAAVEDGAALLDAVEAHHRRFNVFPSEAAYVAVVLWDAHTHLIDCFPSTPRIAFLSPEPGSGKTRALEIIETVTPRPILTTDVSPAALFRSVSDPEARPTVLFDEVDTTFGPKAAGNEDLRGLINSGHRRSGVVLRCVGDGGTQTVQRFPVYAALAMGGLGDLPDTIMSRSIIIRMRRRAPNEKVEPFRESTNGPEGHVLRKRLAVWADTVRAELQDATPEFPEGINDRPADVWEPLLAIAEAAGGHWPVRARAACVQLVTAAKANDKGSIGIRLLTDLRQIFNGADRMPSSVLVDQLNAMDDAPWADLDGKPLNARALARMLGDYVTADNEPIKPRTMKFNGVAAKGYLASDLTDGWVRYCPPLSQESVTAVTAVTAQVRPLFPVTDTGTVTGASVDPPPAIAAGGDRS